MLFNRLDYASMAIYKMLAAALNFSLMAAKRTFSFSSRRACEGRTNVTMPVVIKKHLLDSVLLA